MPKTSISVTKCNAHSEGETILLEEIRPEMRALIYLMIGLSLLGIGIILGQVAFAIGFMSGPP